MAGAGPGNMAGEGPANMAGEGPGNMAGEEKTTVVLLVEGGVESDQT